MFIMAMFEFHWLLVFPLVCSTDSYHLQCPDISQRPLRASGYCTTSLRSKYTCLYDTNMLSYSEQCNRNPDFVTPGEKYVISGNLRNVDCSSERYQPFRLWSNVSGECLYKKSLCEGEGQVVLHNGSLIEGRTCRCDYTKGYRFIKRPKQNCSCTPSEEDCSCYISTCPKGSVLSPDYECIQANHHAEWKCSPIETESGSTQTTRIKSNTEKQKQLRISFITVSAMLILILAYTAAVFALWERIREMTNKKGICHAVEDLTKQKTARKNEIASELQPAEVKLGPNKTFGTSNHRNKIKNLQNDQNSSLNCEKGAPLQKDIVKDVELKDDNIIKKLQEVKIKNEDLEQKNREIESKDRQIESINIEIKDIKRAREIEIAQKNEEIANNVRDITYKDKEMAKRDKDIANRDEEIANKKSEIEKLRDIIRKLEMERRDLNNQNLDLKGKIRVFCRVRPLLSKENQGNKRSYPDHIICSGKKEIQLVKTQNAALNKEFFKRNGKDEFRFSYDEVFSYLATQEKIYEEISPLVQSAVDGYNVCIFAYGQTDSGKTYTMEGNSIDGDDRGIIPRAVQQIFENVDDLEKRGWDYNLEATFLEIYNDTIHDLFGDGRKNVNHKIRKINQDSDEVYVSDLKTISNPSKTYVFDLLKTASVIRTKGPTERNIASSRSHSVFTLRLKGNMSSRSETRQGTLHLIDLAGSEKYEGSGEDKIRQNETKAINKSLHFLKNVIREIKNKEAHISFSNCELTKLLKNALGGNSKTLMIVNVSPLEKCLGETYSSLKFANEVNQCQKGTAQQNKIIK